MSIQLPLPFVEWRVIPGYDGRYEVSNRGQVRRAKSNRQYQSGTLLATRPDQLGYIKVTLRGASGDKLMSVHRLVMLAFIGECPPGQVVNHKNGLKGDNRLENLEYCTRKENTQHAIRVIKSDFTSKQWRDNPTRMNEERVREIRRLHKSGVSQRKIATQFGVSQMMISYILKGRYWSHVKD